MSSAAPPHSPAGPPPVALDDERAALVRARAAVEDKLARLLLAAGADPNLRATFCKQLVDMGDEEKEQMKEYRDVTAIGFAQQFVEPNWINPAAIEAIREYGGA